MAIMEVPDSGVRVRMYNPGFGDCFLLAFRGSDGEPVYVMIDCGVHGQYQGGSQRIRKVLQDVRTATGGRLHLVVVTHEHADHVSGFYLGREIFRGKGKKPGIKVDQVWFAWTENPRSRKARRLDRVKRLLLQGLLGGPRRLREDEEGSLLGFYAFDPGGAQAGISQGEALPLGGDKLGVSTRKARDQIRRHAGKNTYLKPKQAPLGIPGVDGVRVFVLGPPEDEKALLSPNPTGEEGEVYEGEADHELHLAKEEAVVAALGAADRVPAAAGKTPSAYNYQPFSGNHRLDGDKVRAHPGLFDFFHQRYGFGSAKAAGSGDSKDPAESKLKPKDSNAWRRIGGEWMASAESLALKLDAATNNTSLVLAFELLNSRRVLLFPGDAQIGNWKSWHQGGWTEKHGLKRGEKITAEDLLNRTVLYKVGHHGSHNATLRKQGLEMMTSEELIALIPVDESWARDRKPHAWKMPFGPLYEALKSQTKGRIIRTDHGIYRGRKGDAEEKQEITAAWTEFPGEENAPSQNDLYSELVIPDE